VERLLLERHTSEGGPGSGACSRGRGERRGRGAPGEAQDHWVEALRQKQGEVEQLRGLAEQKQRLVG